jgi:hypothetical protein
MKTIAFVAISGLTIANARHHHEDSIRFPDIYQGLGPELNDELRDGNEEQIQNWPTWGGPGPVNIHTNELSAEEGIKGWPKWGGLGPVITHRDELSRKEARKVFGDIGKFILGALDDKEASNLKTHDVEASKAGKEAGKVFEKIGQGLLHGLIFGDETHEDELSRKEARKVFGGIGNFLLGALDDEEASKLKTHNDEASKAGREAGKVFEKIGQGLLHGLIFGDETHEDELSRKEARKVFGDIGKFLLGALDDNEVSETYEGKPARKNLRGKKVYPSEVNELHEEELSRKEARKVFGDIGKFLLGALDDNEFYGDYNGEEEENTHWGIEEN